ncbi:hypothetical protein L1S32_06055 [Methanogenium sp. S4BF]|uniref:putative immunity protein n=1 Tax=Methanogenium sp. S4BF TaxID=1789226 RepID=UPI002415FD5E|nr:hypothetical protein [Methanogenium sp. S4BF]WFN35659.1 hypothetical protein L1S32_06055 [Methanogenium sp. S4BF]
MTTKSGFSLARRDEPMRELVRETGHKTLGVWAVDCVERVLPYFEVQYPDDHRPGDAVDALQNWIRTGVFHMADIRKAARDAHAAAREVGRDNAARSAARAAGQAAATAHVATHALAAAMYALQAMYRAANPSDAEAAVARERDWQYRHLRDLRERDVQAGRAATAGEEDKS